MTGVWAVVIAEGIAIALLGLLVLGLLRSHALILKSLHDLGAGLELEKDAAASAGSASGSGGPGPVHVDLERGVVAAERSTGAGAVDVVGHDLDGVPRQWPLRRPGRTLLAFLSSGCHVCEVFWGEFGRGTEIPGRAELLVLVKDDADESPSALKKLVTPGLPVIASSPAWVDFDIPGSPYFVYVEDGRIIGEGSATTWPQVRDLMAQAVADDEVRRARAASGPSPDHQHDPDDADDPDSPQRFARELGQVGIGPGHESLWHEHDPGTAR